MIQGVNHGFEDTQVDVNNLQRKNELNEKIQKVEAFWQEKLVEEQKKAEDQIENLKSSYVIDNEDLEIIKRKADEQEEHLNNMLGTIAEERKAINNKVNHNMLRNHLQIMFKSILKPIYKLKSEKLS